MTTSEDVRARADALLAPISDASPGGDNIAYDPDFDSIKSEVGKLDSPTGGEVDWDKVAREGQALLVGRSKDLLVGCYTAYGLFETQKLPGLAVGLAVLEGMLDKYWESMFPPLKRKRGRGNALGWLVGRLEIALPNLEVSAPDRPALDLVIAGYKSMGAIAREKLEDHAPGMRSVSDALQRIDMKIPKAEAKPEPPAAPPPAPPAAPPPATEAPTAPPPATDAPATPPTAPPPAAPPPAAAPSTAPTPAAAAPAPSPADATTAPPAAAPTPAQEPPKEDAVAKAKAAAKVWLEPLGDPPHGADARYEPEFETIRAEVGKLDSPSGDSEIDWDEIRRLADGILKDKSKDVLIASYLTFGLLASKGLEGLQLGLCVLIGLFEGFENLWPKRPRGRGNALSWLTEQVERHLSSLKPEAKDREVLESLKRILREFGGCVRDKLEDNAPSVRPLEERVQRMMLALPKPEAPKPPPPPPKPQPKPEAAKPAAAAPPPRPAAAPSAPAMPTAAADVGSAEEVNKYLLETGRTMVKAANLLRRAQLSSPTAYRLLRTGLWLHLEKAPPAGPGGKTQIPPLPAQRRTQFGLMESNAKWGALVEETESALGQFRFCLDLQRLSAMALAQLGAEYEPARQALMGEVATLLRRMPNLAELSSGDGTPLADDETKEWIASEVAAAEGGGGGGGAGLSDDPGEAFAKIGSMMKGGKGGEAMKAAKQAIDDTGSLRLRFIRRLALAQGCFEGGEPKLARSMFVALDRELSELGLDRWEPRLASQCLEGLLKASRAAAQKGSPTVGIEAALERLCLLDPVAAAKFTG